MRPSRSPTPRSDRAFHNRRANMRVRSRTIGHPRMPSPGEGDQPTSVTVNVVAARKAAAERDFAGWEGSWRTTGY